jgi:hypothetical protein
MTNQTQDSLSSPQSNYLEAIFDPFDGSSKLLSTISSANFDGAIPDLIIEYPNATTEDLVPGRFFSFEDTYYLITRVDEDIDPITTETISYNVWYTSSGVERYKTILSGVKIFTDGTQLQIRKDDWNGKSVGQSGWTITTEGNSVFSNVAVRGRIEATEGYFDGRLFVGDPLDPDSPGSMRIGTNVDGTLESPGTQDGIFINTNNYWYDTGLFSIGDGTAGVVWNGSVLAITGQVTATSGTIGGFTIGPSSLYGGSGSNFVGIIPASLPFFAGATANDGTGAVFKVTNAGILTATNANITGSITATSGTFTGTVNANSGYFQSGYIGGTTSGWQISSNTIQSVGGNDKITLLNGSVPKIYIGTGDHGNSNTSFYVDGDGKFSIKDRIVWDPSGSGTLTVDGFLRGFVNATTPVTANPGNTMGFGLFSTGSSGVGLKINDNNYWFADAGNPRIRVGSSNNYLSYQSSSDLLEVTGTIKANSGNIGGEFGWQIEGSKIFSGSDETYIALQSSGEISPLSISSIVINDEGNGLSSIYILSQIPSGYNSSTVEELIGTSLSLDSETSIVLTSPNDIESLTGYSYPIKEVSNFQWSISNGDAIEGSPVSEGYVTFIIYGEDNNQTFVDETLSGLTGEIINVGIAGSGIYIGSETPTDAPFSVNQNGILKASSGKIGGFNFESVSDEGAGGSFISDSENFERDVYSSPYGIELSPTNGIILRANSSLADSTSYFIEGTETLYPSGENAPEEYRNILRATGFTIIDNTGAASNVTINPFMGIRSESVSALNIAKNGSFEYKAGSSTSYTYSGVGWTAGTGLTLSSLSATTSGYSFPSLPYGQQFVGKLSWTTAVSEFLKTEFLLDPSGDEQNYLSPESSLTYLTAGSNGIAVDFAVYNSEPSGLFGTNHYVAAYPISDLKVTYTDTDGITQEIKPFNSSSLQVSDMLKNITNDEVIFDGGYLYLSAPYSNNILTFAVTATSGIVIDEGVGDGSATLTIGTHPFYAGQYVSLFNGTTDLGEEDVFEILSVTATQIVVDDSFYNITGVNTVKSDGRFIYSSSATRGKNGINFNIPLSEYEDADYSLPFTLHLPGYYYGVTFDVLVSREATFTRASSPEIPLEINFDPTIATINNYDAQYPALEPLSLLSTDTVAVFDSDLPGEGSYDLIYNTSPLLNALFRFLYSTLSKSLPDSLST